MLRCRPRRRRRPAPDRGRRRRRTASARGTRSGRAAAAVATPALTLPAPNSTNTASRPAISPRQKPRPPISRASPDWSERWANSSGKADMTPRSLFAMPEWAIRSPPSRNDPDLPSRPAALRHACTDLARDAAREIMRIYAGDLGERDKADNSPVTDADHAAEAVIVAGLRALTPGRSWSPKRRWRRATFQARRQPVLAGRSARRHQGIHQEERRVHGEHRLDRGRQADARHRAGAVATRCGAAMPSSAPTRAREAAPSARSRHAARRPAGLACCAAAAMRSTATSTSGSATTTSP